MKIKHIFLLLALAGMFACKPELEDFTTSAGTADFSNYVSIGNSLTAGYADSELYRSGQLTSFPSILAGQMQAAGGGDFTQPLMFDELGFGSRRVLDASIPGPVLAEGTPDPQNFQSIAQNGPYNNMGVPGAKSFHLLAKGYGQLNPYFGRFASSPTTSVLADVLAQNPTFFSMWIGSNDVLTHAISGGTTDSITDINTFSFVYNTLLQQLTANGAKGVVANIPDITSIPYFTFINTQLPHVGLVLDAETADLLNGAYAQFELFLASIGISYSYGFNFQAGPNAFVVEDETLPLPPPFNVRQMQAGELFLLVLPTDSLLNHGMGSVNQATDPATPFGIRDRYFLSLDEIDQIQSAIAGYNNAIKSLADQYGLAHVDMNAKLSEAANGGIEYEGILFTDAFISGNAFSLDGVHLTGQGYALAANFFIEAINNKYNAQLTPVSPGLYPGIYYK
jgi:lysophospholipase L1-like esterase